MIENAYCAGAAVACIAYTICDLCRPLFNLLPKEGSHMPCLPAPKDVLREEPPMTDTSSTALSLLAGDETEYFSADDTSQKETEYFSADDTSQKSKEEKQD